MTAVDRQHHLPPKLWMNYFSHPGRGYNTENKMSICNNILAPYRKACHTFRLTGQYIYVILIEMPLSSVSYISNLLLAEWTVNQGERRCLLPDFQKDCSQQSDVSTGYLSKPFKPLGWQEDKTRFCTDIVWHTGESYDLIKFIVAICCFL